MVIRQLFIGSLYTCFGYQIFKILAVKTGLSLVID